MDRYAVIDIGTNSIRLLIAETEEGIILNSKKHLEMTRIGKGVNETKMIADDAIDRSVKALKDFKEMALNEDVDLIKAIATSAVRDANNRDVFIKRVKDEVGLDIEVISGKKEALLGFQGVINGIHDIDDDDILVIDIGGGSTELIIGNRRGLKYQESLNVGAVRMTDKHIESDPINQEDIENLLKDIRYIIKDEIEKIKKHNITKVIGIGGTITTLGAVDQNLERYNRDKIHNYVLNIDNINTLIDNFKTMDNEERKKVKGLEPKRADIILAGSLILYEIINEIEAKNIMISEYDNLEGYIFLEIM